MEAVLEDNGLKEFIESDVPKSGSSNDALLDAWKKKIEKTRRVLLEGVRTIFCPEFMGNPLHS